MENEGGKLWGRFRLSWISKRALISWKKVTNGDFVISFVMLPCEEQRCLIQLGMTQTLSDSLLPPTTRREFLLQTPNTNQRRWFTLTASATGQMSWLFKIQGWEISLEFVYNLSNLKQTGWFLRIFPPFQASGPCIIKPVPENAEDRPLTQLVSQ